MLLRDKLIYAKHIKHIFLHHLTFFTKMYHNLTLFITRSYAHINCFPLFDFGIVVAQIYQIYLTNIFISVYLRKFAHIFHKKN